MQSIQFATFLFLSAVLVICRGDDGADLALQQAFGDLKDDIGDARDNCLQNSGLTLADLKVYLNPEEIPERDLCFYKCFYEKIGFISEIGKLVVDDLQNLPELKGINVEKIDNVKKCVADLDPIKECTDLKKTHQCFKLLGE